MMIGIISSQGIAFPIIMIMVALFSCYGLFTSIRQKSLLGCVANGWVIIFSIWIIAGIIRNLKEAGTF